MHFNSIIQNLPKYLQGFIVDQQYDQYTAQDHAIWRFVMRQNVNYLKNVAHSSYLDGLAKTGIGIEKIPSIDEMNQILKNIGWAAVTVDGFIPPAAFMEFQAHNVLVIAADIRQINHIEYTPAPDIIHEAAGHAPIIADPEYAEYLRLFGETGSKAFSSKKDYEVYEAVRHLSILKEDPRATKNEIEEAEKKLFELSDENEAMSEMTQIRNLHWWTVEYGLIGELHNPKLYGAGLLSSIGESVSCLKDTVKKLPYDINAKDYPFDITTQQPQLFVTPDFKHLIAVLNQFKDSMALSRGGREGLKKAIESENVATCIYSSGLQVTGVVTDAIYNHDEEPVYLKTTGPTSLNFDNRQLDGHDKNYHKDGFGSPVGRLKNASMPLEKFGENDLEKHKLIKGEKAKLEFISGIKVEGTLSKALFKEGNLVLLSFNECTVSFKDKMLFQPSWGIYDMAVGEQITSVFSGAANPDAYGIKLEPPKEKTRKIQYTEPEKAVHSAYQNIRDLRKASSADHSQLASVWDEIKQFDSEWLLNLEVYELAKNHNNTQLSNEVYSRLMQLAESNSEFNQLINNGLRLISS